MHWYVDGGGANCYAWTFQMGIYLVFLACRRALQRALHALPSPEDLCSYLAVGGRVTAAIHIDARIYGGEDYLPFPGAS